MSDETPPAGSQKVAWEPLMSFVIETKAVDVHWRMGMQISLDRRVHGHFPNVISE